MDRQLRGHLICVFTSLVWGSTFIATRILLGTFTNAQVMLLRFILAYAAALVIDHRFPRTRMRDEARFAFLAFIGVTIYHTLENAALQRTSTANASILVALAPMFTMLLTRFALREGRFTRRAVIGFAVSMAGVVLVVFNGAVVMKLNPLGDLCALGAALCWGSYTVIVRALQKEYPSTLIGRKSLFWSLVFVVPVALLERAPLDISRLWSVKAMSALLFCGILASGVCNVISNFAIEDIGPVATNTYLYALPFIAMVVARIALGEPISFMGVVGAVMTVLGVIVSSYTPPKRA